MSTCIVCHKKGIVHKLRWATTDMKTIFIFIVYSYLVRTRYYPVCPGYKYIFQTGSGLELTNLMWTCRYE